MHPDVDDGTRLITGTLTRNAEVRTRPLDGAQSLPILCFDIQTDGPAHLPVHVEQPFEPGHHAQAEAAARRLRKGTHVTVQTPVLGWRLVVPNATHVHTHKPEEVSP
jgi:hypothetical protein